jgi:hypothetical protein
MFNKQNNVLRWLLNRFPIAVENIEGKHELTVKERFELYGLVFAKVRSLTHENISNLNVYFVSVQAYLPEMHSFIDAPPKFYETDNNRFDFGKKEKIRSSLEILTGQYERRDQRSYVDIIDSLCWEKRWRSVKALVDLRRPALDDKKLCLLIFREVSAISKFNFGTHSLTACTSFI